MTDTAVVTGRKAPTQSGFGTGWRVVARKEFADHVRSARFIVLIAVFAAVGVACVLAASGAIRSAAPAASEAPAVFLLLLTIQNDPVPFSLVELFIGLLGPLLGIAFGFDAISNERSQGTLPRLLSQPIHRDEVIIGKFVAGLSIVSVTLFAMGLFVTGVGMFRLGITPNPAEIGRFFVWIVVAILFVGFWQALAILLSTRAGAATAVLLALGFWLVVGLFGGFIFQAAGGILAPGDDPAAAQRAEFVVSRLSPVSLFSETSGALLDPQVRYVSPFTTAEQVDRAYPASELTLTQSLSIVWPQVIGLLAMTGVLFAFAFISFMRQEIRA